MVFSRYLYKLLQVRRLQQVILSMCFFDQLFPMRCPHCEKETPLYLYEDHLKTHPLTSLNERVLREAIQYTMVLMKRWTLGAYEIRSSCI